MSLLKLKLYYNTNALELEKQSLWLFSDISTIPVSELNLSSTQHRKKLILELSCVHIEYVKKSGYTSESKGTQLLLHYQNVPFCNKNNLVDWAGSDNATINIEQLLTAWCISLGQALFWSFALL